MFRDAWWQAVIAQETPVRSSSHWSLPGAVEPERPSASST